MWHLKKRDGRVFGPVDISTLQRWASEGRVTPDDLLSEDEQTWTAAPDVQALAMDWMVELEDGGRYGPIHLLALRDFLKDGTVPPDARLSHKNGRETHAAGEALLAALLERNHQLEEKAARRTAHGEGEPPEVVTQLQQALKDLAAEKDRIEQEFRAYRQQMEAAPVEESGGERQTTVALMNAAHDLSRNYDLLLRQFQDKAQELQAALETKAAVEQDAEEHMRRMEEALHRERLEAQQARRRLAELEQAHFELVKSYRDMNDRLIRLRQEHAQGPAPSAKAVKEKRPTPLPDDGQGPGRRRRRAARP
jgi:hypothetical protein